MLAPAMLQTPPAPRQPRTLSAGRRGTGPARRLPLAATRCAATQGPDRDASAAPTLAQLLGRAAAAGAASGLLLVAAVPASLADISTVTAQQATEMAKPLKQQPVNKERVWALFVLGATALFGSTVVLENNSQWFPAISRANQAMKVAREQLEAREAAATAEQAAFEQRLAAVQAERQADQQADGAVLEGLLEARQRSADSMPPTAAAGPAAAVQAAAAPAAAAELAPALGAEEEAEEEEHQPSSSSSAPVPSDSHEAGDAPGGDGPRKPLFEISAEQIEASSAQRMQELQQELERRKGGAAAAGAGAASGGGAQQEP